MPNLYFTNPPQTTDSPDTHIARISVATGRGFSDVRGTSATTHVPFVSANATSGADITTAPDSGSDSPAAGPGSPALAAGRGAGLPAQAPSAPCPVASAR